MIQNIIAQIIVFTVAAFTIFSIVKNLTAKKNSHCGGCSGCSLKELPAVKHAKTRQTGNFQSKNLMLLKNGK
jgi:hypothetical protein